MPNTITTNTSANTALRFMTINNMNANSAIGKVSSGSRIVKASDDAASLAVGTKLAADIASLKQASINASHGSAVSQVADGGLGRISDLLSRMKVLATESVSGSLSDTERGYLDSEYQELINEIDAIATQTRFNNQSLLDGTTASLDFLVGTDAADTITVTFTDVSADAIGGDLTATDVGTQATATTAIGALNTAIDDVADARADMGAFMSRFEFHLENLATSVENVTAARSALVDVDVGAEMTAFTSAQVLLQASTAMLAQANQLPQNFLRLLQ